MSDNNGGVCAGERHASCAQGPLVEAEARRRRLCRRVEERLGRQRAQLGQRWWRVRGAAGRLCVLIHCRPLRIHVACAKVGARQGLLDCARLFLANTNSPSSFSFYRFEIVIAQKSMFAEMMRDIKFALSCQSSTKAVRRRSDFITVSPECEKGSNQFPGFSPNY